MAYGDLSLDAPLKPNKGLEGGACNRQSCQAEPALFWNHGSHSWYCGDCARDIGEDHVNKLSWYLSEHFPGHPQFETREQMDARAAAAPPPAPRPPEWEGLPGYDRKLGRKRTPTDDFYDHRKLVLERIRSAMKREKRR